MGVADAKIRRRRLPPLRTARTEEAVSGGLRRSGPPLTADPYYDRELADARQLSAMGNRHPCRYCGQPTKSTVRICTACGPAARNDPHRLVEGGDK
jgi:hypothetical protein